MSQQISIPNRWAPRPHQVGIWNYLASDGVGKRAVAVWHRRAGKDSTALNFTAAEMFKEPGVYWHMLPTTVQARKVIWNGIDSLGRRIIDQAFPPVLRKRTNNQEMLIELKPGGIEYEDAPGEYDSREEKSGSIWQLCGSDNYDSLVGSNPRGVVFSEYSIADPAAWDYIRPILVENGGWAVFIYTPRGKNHGYRLAKMAETNPKWYCETLSINDTSREDGSPVVTLEAIEEERMAGMPEEKLQQEFYCSWNAGMEGAFYTEELAYAELEGYHETKQFLWDPLKPVITVWDLGVRDMMVCGIFQMKDGHPILIDEIHRRNKGVDWFWNELQKKPYNYVAHYAPHDVAKRDQWEAKPTIEIAEEHGLVFDACPKLSIEDGIQNVRPFLRHLRINRDKCEYILDSLAAYRRTWDENKKIWMDKPLHDWASHASDMIRYAAIVINADMFSAGTSTAFKVKRAI